VDVADEDLIQLYVLEADGTQLGAYTDWPSITVNKAGAASSLPALFSHIRRRQRGSILSR
jgi:hypothetical protein